jgi:hypothetical protein
MGASIQFPKASERSYLSRALPLLRGMSTNHFSSEGKRMTSFSNASISSVSSLTPVAYVVSTTLTTGCLPLQVIDRANPTAASTESSNDPFQCISSTPQHRSIGFYLLW